MKKKRKSPFFTATAPLEPENLHPVITCAGTIHLDDLPLTVHSAKVAAADELFDCLNEAVYKTCYYCLEGNLFDPSHAGDHCPFSQKQPCMVNKWKAVLKRAGKFQLPYCVSLKRLKGGKRHAHK